MVSKEFKKVFAMIKAMQYIGAPKPVEEIRKSLEKIAKISQLADDVKIKEVRAYGGVKGAWITFPESNNVTIIMYLHGGYVSGSSSTHYNLISRVGRVAQAKVFSIDYSLGPEQPFPAGLDDAVNAYKCLICLRKINPNNIIL